MRVASRPAVLLFTFLAAATGCLPSAPAQQTDVPALLAEGRLADAVQSLQQELEQPGASESVLRYRLGVVQFLQAIEQLGQAQYRHGLMSSSRLSIPLLRLPLPPNRDPEQLTIEKARGFIADFLQGLKTAEATLAAVKPSGDVLTLDLASVCIDLNGDDEIARDESLFAIVNTLMRTGGGGLNEDGMQIAFDDGDVLWLRGYCHVMCAFCEVVLAYNWDDLFERTAHLFFPSTKTPYVFLLQERAGDAPFTLQNGLDLIAMIHCLHFEVRDREGLLRALQHLEQVPQLSRESWELINAETDNNREWLPNPRQAAAISQLLRITPEMQSQWNLFLDEMDAILRGDTLLPFWRGTPGINPFDANGASFHPKLGINVRRIFTEPQTFDLVLWIHGSGMASFLEEGPITKPERWSQITSAFRGQFMFFAVWFN
ncbi:MAG: hypothetical protein RLZZ436_3410 [Planctomycetota bacterium]|jgi:hypothetical protein